MAKVASADRLAHALRRRAVRAETIVHILEASKDWGRHFIQRRVTVERIQIALETYLVCGEKIRADIIAEACGVESEFKTLPAIPADTPQDVDSGTDDMG